MTVGLPEAITSRITNHVAMLSDMDPENREAIISLPGTFV
jgi:hypothetical protein